MGSYSYMNTSASSSTSYSYSSNSSTDHFPYQQEARSGRKPPSGFHSALHSVRRRQLPAKKFLTKKPSIAPMPPNPPKIYNVHPTDFKDVVQKLTCAPEFQPTRLQEVAPPPLSLSPPHHRPANNLFSVNWDAANLAAEGEEKNEQSFSFENTFRGLSPLGFSLSPASLAMCSAFLLSPGTLSSVEPNAVV